MRPSVRRLRNIALVALATTSVIAGLYAAYFDPLRKAETYTRDLRQCWGRKAPLDDRLVFLAIDKSSVQLDSLFPEEIDASPALKLMKSGFPWSREVYALIAQRLVDAGASVVMFDLLFPTAANGDEAFRNVLTKYPYSLLIGCDFVGEQKAEGTSWRLDLPTESLVEARRPIDARLGYVTFWSDPDGAVRRVRLRTSLQELSGQPAAADAERFESLEARALRRLDRPDLIPAQGDRAFRFAGGPHTVEPRSIYEIFVPEMWNANYLQGAFFKNKIVIVGPEGSWSHDVHATPFRIIDGDGALMPGPELHINALNAALHSEFLTEWGPLGETLCLLLTALWAAAVSIPRGPIWRTILTFVSLVLYFGLTIFFYNGNGLLMPVAAPVLIMMGTVLGNIVLDYRAEQKEKREIRSTLGHYVGENVLEEILHNPAPFLHSLTGVRKTVTVMFADLRDFTALTQSRSPADLIAQLNEYFSVMTDVILEEKGTVDKLMGDGIMAIWGNLHTEGAAADAQAALRAALAMRRDLEALNKKWETRNWPTLQFGIGLAYGEAFIGNIGSERKMDFTAIGAVINKAARIEQVTREMGHDILLGPDLALLADNAFNLSPVGLVQVKGIEQRLAVFALHSPKQPPAAAGGVLAQTVGKGEPFSGQTSSPTVTPPRPATTL